MTVQLDVENADRDITAQVTVLTHTPDVVNPTLCQGLILLGDGAKDLDGNGGNFEYTITVGGVVVEPDPLIVVHSVAVRTAYRTESFPVPAGSEVILRVKSPNGADNDVDVTAHLYDVVGATQAQVDRNAFLIESQRGFHTWQGNHYYVDPVNGDTHANGNRGGRNDPYLTIQDCHDNAVTDSNHDVIFLVAGAGAGVTTHTVNATTTISKRYTFIRGPGRDFIVTRTGNGDTFEITADGVEISGIQIGTAATGSGNGVTISAVDFTRIHDCWFLDTRGDGIHCERGSNCQFHGNHFEGTGVTGGGQGIHISGSGGAGNANDNVIHNNHFADTDGTAILIEQGTTNDTTIHHNEIHNAGEGGTGWGIDVGPSSENIIIHSNILGNNADGDIRDGGTSSIVKNNSEWSIALPGIMYVDVNNGSDTNDGRSWTLAKETFADAVSSANDGDTIMMAAGAYPLAADVQWLITLHIKAAGIGATMINGGIGNHITPGLFSSMEDLTLNAQVQLDVNGGDTPWTEFRMRRVWQTHLFDCFIPIGDCNGARVIADDCYFQASDCVNTSSAEDFHMVLNDCVLNPSGGSALVITGNVGQCTVIMHEGLLAGNGQIEVNNLGKVELHNVGVENDSVSIVNAVVNGVNYDSTDFLGSVDLFQVGAQAALVENNLDHLLRTATAGADMTGEVADGTIFSRMWANGDTSDFDPSTDGLRPTRVRGDAAWITAVGFNVVVPDAAGTPKTLTVAEREASADALLARDVSNANPVAEEHSLRFVILQMTESNLTTLANFLTVHDTTGAVIAQKPVTSDSDADPVTGIS